MTGLDWVLHGVTVLAFLVQIDGGVRSLQVRDVHARRNRSRIGFRLMAFASSSLQILARVSSSSSLIPSKGTVRSFWEG
jgi:hypothetical protein